MCGGEFPRSLFGEEEMVRPKWWGVWAMEGLSGGCLGFLHGYVPGWGEGLSVAGGGLIFLLSFSSLFFSFYFIFRYFNSYFGRRDDEETKT